ncbi:transposase [Flavobacterium fluviale]|uniref:Transposase IS200-like domain-containing protein n=1 Tax=Flavobacterium fluviale TaxID=2249356 RepID=A0A344LV38_9FLAO|nr:transposase [Flavobacterium fluviale]AXB57780.1 hypothetical protein HYN86_14715 [Flavobacterium fluviale]
MKILYKEELKTDSNRLKDWDYSSEAVYFITIVTKNRECIFGTVENEKMILNENGKIIENELFRSINIRKNWFFHNWIIMPNHIHLLIEIQTSNVSSVETHSSASTSSISKTDYKISLATNVAETHCSAPLQYKSESELDYKYESNSVILSNTHIVETHSSASTSSISKTDYNISLATNFAETHCSAPLQNQTEPKLSRKSNSISSFVGIFKSITTKQINGIDSIWQANYHDHIVRNYKTFEKIYDYIKHNPRSWETDSLK